MQHPALRPVMIVLRDGFADWETALISDLSVSGLGDAVPQADEIVVLCGSEAWTRADAPDLSAMLRPAPARGTGVAAICAGTLARARAGLLAGRAHISNGLDFLRHWLPDHAEAAHDRDQPRAVADGGIITAPITFAAAVLHAAGLPQDRLDDVLARAGAELRP